MKRILILMALWCALVLPASAELVLPDLCITQATPDALSALEEGKRVLLIELDGWGYLLMQHHLDAQPYLSSLDAEQASAAFPPISPTGLASILTGALPEQHGVTARGIRQQPLPDLFQMASDLGKTCAYVEGDTALIETSLPAVLSPDLNNENGTDDEVFENAQKRLDADLVVVHFHGVDDVATTFGPYAPQVAQRLTLVDDYVRQLVQNFDGRVIITADHGLHPQSVPGDDRLGSHGDRIEEDMLVPYVVLG